MKKKYSKKNYGKKNDLPQTFSKNVDLTKKPKKI